MVTICLNRPWLKISLNLVPCRDTQAAWQKQSGGLQTADFGPKPICFSYYFHVILILFPYWFHTISILLPYFLEKMKTICNKCGETWKEYGSHGFQNVGRVRKRYGINVKKRDKYEQSLALGQATKHLPMPQDWVYCMFNHIINPYS